MLEFRVANIVPPGGRYFYEVEGLPLQDATKSGLLTQINRAYAARNEEVPADIWAKVQDYMCRYLPEGFCFGDDDGRPRARVVTIQDVRHNTERMIQQSEMAPPSKSKFNAAKCLRCPRNDRQMCTTCSGLSAWASRRVGRPDMPADYSYLGICEVDCSALVAKVNRTGLPKSDEYPGGCWIMEDKEDD